MKTTRRMLVGLVQNFIIAPTIIGTLLLLVATTICQVLCEKSGGILDVFEPATVAQMQRWCLMALKYVIPFIVLPGMAYISVYFLYSEMKSVCRSKKKGLIVSIIVLLCVLAAMPFLWKMLFPEGVVQKYSLWQRLFVQIGTCNIQKLVQNIIEAGDTWTWGAAIAIAVSFLFAFVGYQRDVFGKLFYYGVFCVGAVLSIATGALAIGLFSVFDKRHPQFADPIAMPDFWGNVVPMIGIGFIIVCVVAFALSWVGWRVMSSRGLIRKSFSLVFAVISAASMIFWSAFPFLIGLFLVPLFLLVICLCVAIVFGGIYTKAMFGEFVRDMTAPPQQYSGPDETTYKSKSGEEFVGSGEHPYSVTSRSDGSTYDLGHDGRYHERCGNRTLET